MCLLALFFILPSKQRLAFYDVYQLSRSLDSQSDSAKLYMFYMSNENIIFLRLFKVFLGVDKGYNYFLGNVKES